MKVTYSTQEEQAHYTYSSVVLVTKFNFSLVLPFENIFS